MSWCDFWIACTYAVQLAGVLFVVAGLVLAWREGF